MLSLTDVALALEARRKELGLTQKDMLMRIGMSQQQYQRVEAGGDTRLSTLLRILEGMRLELRLVPGDKTQDIDAVLQGRAEILPKHGSEEEARDRTWNSELGDLEDKP